MMSVPVPVSPLSAVASPATLAVPYGLVGNGGVSWLVGVELVWIVAAWAIFWWLTRPESQPVSPTPARARESNAAPASRRSRRPRAWRLHPVG